MTQQTIDPANKSRLSQRDADVWDAVEEELRARVGRSSADLEREAHRAPRP